ncbi:CAI-1 autoinducer sensor kinase/phosphatase CqsS [Stieleria maiorica]|uniref:CAI-1 autoinducer sensor kinase/phosphatase CqsS n=1 Tax=Stieleria maiorica TaxID=2795974 RepID=A0A5B9MC99_9BACT|nr:CAI-1 autoinducer sensor kinase/phosphatase CqsS [Stieleria maiorica]
MIVDDVRAYRKLLHQWFVEWGFSCSLASGAEEAWRLIQHQKVDLVVTDIDMPGVSGLDLIRAIRESGGADLKRVPVIAISSLQDDEIESITKRVGAIRFSPKPLDRDGLLRDVVASLQPDSSGAPLWSPASGREEAPVPEAPVPEAPVPEAPVPEAPVPEAPVPEAPVPEAPVPESPDACPTISPKLRRLLRGESDHPLRPKK